MFSTQVYADNSDILFTDITSKEIQNFENEIAYFFGARERQKIAKHYQKALQVFETLNKSSNSIETNNAMKPYLIKAYREVSHQTGLSFDVQKAATYEIKLINAQAYKTSGKNIANIMTDLYKIIFDTDRYEIRKATMLRTFLYQYKIDVLQSGHKLSKYDKAMMISLARESEDLLNYVIDKKKKTNKSL